jgi:hypothetical protein
MTKKKGFIENLYKMGQTVLKKNPQTKIQVEMWPKKLMFFSEVW